MNSTWKGLYTKAQLNLSALAKITLTLGKYLPEQALDQTMITRWCGDITPT